MLQKPNQTSDEISPELMRYLDRDYWENKEKEKAEQKAKALSSAYTVSPSLTSSSSVVSSTPPSAIESTKASSQGIVVRLCALF